MVVLLLWGGCFLLFGDVFAQEGRLEARSRLKRYRPPEELDRKLIGFDMPGEKVRRVSLIAQDGGRVGWSPDGEKIAFDRKEQDGYFDVWVMDADGSDQECLTCGHFEISKNNGTAAFCPCGDYLLFTAQNPYYAEPDGGVFDRYLTSPGLGVDNDLWVLRLDDLSLSPLTHVKKQHSALHPHFSYDGTKVVWSEIVSSRFQRLGVWVIKLADFSFENGRPRLSNIQTLKPKNLQLYETHGFSSDGRNIIFSGVSRDKHYYDMEIYVLDLETNRVSQLTDNNEWDEHAHFTPDGRHIIWASSKDIPQNKQTRTFLDTLKSPPRLDLWIMNADGSQKRRLSYFNDPQNSAYLESAEGVAIGDFDIHPAGNRIIAEMQYGRQEIIVRIDLDQRLL